jgi:long-chain acyl-CoA synthetase
MDSDGWFYVIDRIKDQINASGFKVWPREVEDALYEHPAVAECAVVGIPDAYRGETVRACIVLRAGQQVDAQQLEAFSRARLAAYKVPRSIVFFDQLPKTASGKILRRELKLTDPTLLQHSSGQAHVRSD